MNLRTFRTGLFFLLVAPLLMGCEAQRLAWEWDPTPTPWARDVMPTPAPAALPTVVPVPPIPPEVEQAAQEWPMANKDYANTRATTDSQINAETVQQLGVAWTFRIPGAAKWGSAASNPLVLNSIVYFQDLESNTFALDLETGAVIWERMYGEKAFGPNGPAVGWGKLFVQGGVNHIYALDDEITQRGLEVFLSTSCVYCHTIRGTPAVGEVGPDLTHLASRLTLAAGALENNRGNLGGWILDPQHIKPGSLMPPTNLTGEELQALLAYLETLH
jgi:mono/diheme cytochrome c family protein